MKTKPIMNWTDINILKGILLLRKKTKKKQDWQRLTNPNNDRMEVEEYTE